MRPWSTACPCVLSASKSIVSQKPLRKRKRMRARPSSLATCRRTSGEIAGCRWQAGRRSSQNDGRGDPEPRLHSHYCNTISAFEKAKRFDKAYVARLRSRHLHHRDGRVRQAVKRLCRLWPLRAYRCSGANPRPFRRKSESTSVEVKEVTQVLRCLSQREGNTESKALLAIAFLRLLGIEAQILRPGAIGAMRLSCMISVWSPTTNPRCCRIGSLTKTRCRWRLGGRVKRTVATE